MTKSTAAPATAPATSTEPGYEALAERFRPVFARIAEGSLAREQDRVLPFEQVRWLNEAGFGRLRVPAAHGGDGIGFEPLFRLLIELAESDPSVAHLYRSHFAFVETVGLEDQQFQERWYPRVVAGEIFGNAATERSGNVLGATGTTLSRAGGDWLLNGKKFYTTGTIFADWIAVTASTEGLEGRQYAVVSTTAPGVEILDDWDGFGQQLTGTGTTVFRDAVVPDANIIQRSVSTTHEPAFFQLVLLAVLAGVGRAALADARVLVRDRKRTFNTGSGELFRHDPLILQLVGQLSAKVFAAESVVRAAARELDAAADQDLDFTLAQRYTKGEVAVEKAQLLVPELVLSAAQQLFDVTGASSTSKSKALDRHWRNARTVATHNPAVFKARMVGDYEVNGTTPEGLHSIGDARPAG
ncbi:acyl-CoA dehydrogenase family protein [Arthrobacter sp. B3I4]|uniref:acyl-CoA dehydrogenase family protein n=1 Tax=Arthrobacter sp. B3I4 TaxID=3042267 RepID=UPI00277DCF27|nr:acyl-CoA dehydrogenase family protein [Arthrobacter sp. B3I4]MDQ0754377.1 alkylation response protein AidB-like acyl-CoA dehydrogenase [Arthrobacter sp. B3I4]